MVGSGVPPEIHLEGGRVGKALWVFAAKRNRNVVCYCDNAMPQPHLTDSHRFEGEELARLQLDEMGALGDTLAHLDGETVNVFGGIVGEEVVARIVRFRRRRKSNTSGLVVEVLRPSPHRVSPPCPYFGPCSGCQWQHIEYPHQLTLKRQAVELQLHRIAELSQVTVADTVPSPMELMYRNHARFVVRRGGSLGFTNRITRSFVQVDRCMLMSPWINDTLGKLQGNCEETTSISIRYGANTGDWLIQPTLHGRDVPVQTGQTHYREALLGKDFRVASPSFFQVNTTQAERLVELVRDRLQLSASDILLDGYAGVGTFAVLMAPYVGRAIAVEESESAVRDTAINGRGVENLELRQGKVEDVLISLEKMPDKIILDPPRAGCQPGVLEAVARWAPSRTAYVSCDPETLARDLCVLVRAGLRVESVEPVDMFPQTHHVECVATLVPAC